MTRPALQQSDTPPPAVQSMTVLVGAVIVHDRERERVLLLRRASDAKFAPGRWDLPVGKSEPGEPVTATAARELYEETGLVVREADLRVAYLVHGARGVQAPAGFLTVVFVTEEWSGEPENREPDKHAEVAWAEAGALPEPFVPSLGPPLSRFLSGGVSAEMTVVGWSEEGEE